MCVCFLYGGLCTYPSPSRPRQTHPQPSVELDAPERLLRSGLGCQQHRQRSPLCSPVRVRGGVSTPTKLKHNKEEKERKRRVSALPDSATAVMVMIVRGGAECGFCATDKCWLKGQVGARPGPTPVHVHGE